MDQLPPDVLSHALRLLDGPSLAAACSAASYLRSLSSSSDIWLHLCLSTWPSLHHPHLLPFLSPSPSSFFAAAFPFPDPSAAPRAPPRPLSNLVSAVDIFHRGTLVFSGVANTNTSSPWFLGSPFLIDAAVASPSPPLAVSSPEDLTLSWILIDPDRGTAVNVSSRRPVAVAWHWHTGETAVRFASAAGGGLIVATVTCAESTGILRRVTLTAEDTDGVCLTGGRTARIVTAMMEGPRRGNARQGENAYSEFLKRRQRRKESRERREGLMDFFCIAMGVAVFAAFAAFLSLLVFRQIAIFGFSPKMFSI